MTIQSIDETLWASTTTTIQRRDRHAVTAYLSFTIVLSIAHREGENLEGSGGIRVTILADESDIHILQNGSLNDERISRKHWKESYLRQSLKTGSRSVIDFHLVLRARDGFAASPLFKSKDIDHEALHVLHREYLPCFSAVLKFEAVRRVPGPTSRGKVILTQYITVLPTATRTPFHFPPGIATQIMDCILESYSLPEHGGRLPWSTVNIIARFAQISRAWLPIIDILWNYSLGTPSDCIPIENLLLLADILQAKPYVAQKFRFLAFCVTSRHGSGRTETSGAKNLSQAIIIFLKHCPNIIRIDIPRGQLIANQKLLKELSKVEQVLIEGPASMQIAPVENLLNIIKKWPDLEHFSCSHWCYSGLKVANSGAIAPFKLSSLKIRKSVVFLGKTLSYLLSNPHRRIRVVELTEISSLTNQDYTSLFSLISSTVEELVVWECKVKPSSKPSPDEAKALDKTLSEMLLLKKAKIDSSLLTIKSIAGKSFGNDALKDGTCSLAIYFASFDQLVSFLGIRPDSGWYQIRKSGDELIAAVERTGWGRIEFHGECFRWRANKRMPALFDALQGVKKVANRRGIAMKVFDFHVYHRGGQRRNIIDLADDINSTI